MSKIISARQHLRKTTSDSKSSAATSSDLSNDLMSFIRGGVKLKKVNQTKIKKDKGLSDIAASMLRTTLAKMNKHMTDSSDEEEDADEFV